MASGRFISSTLGDSERFSSLTDPRYQVAFILIVTWADAEGRFIADPITLNGKLFTRLGWTPDLVRAALDQLHDVGLVTLYDVDGKPYGVVEKFHQHNTITRKADGSPAREAASKLPPPPEEPRSGSGGTGQPPPTSSAPTAQRLRSGRAETAPEVEVQVQVQGEVEENTLVVRQDEAPAPPAVVEAAPRRGGPEPPRYQAFVDAWNANRGPLPRVQSLNSTRRGQIDRLRRELGEDALELFTDAVKQVASDKFWRQKGYGFGILLTGGKVLERAEMWRNGGGLNDSDRRLADKAAAVAEAIGGL